MGPEGGNPQGHLAPAAVGESIQLPDQLLAALLAVQFEMFQGRPFVFFKPVANRDAPPNIEDMPDRRQLVRVQIARAFDGLYLHERCEFYEPPSRASKHIAV